MKVYKLRRSHLENAQRADLSTAILKHNDPLHLLTRHPTVPVSDAWLRSSRYRVLTVAAGGAWRAQGSEEWQCNKQVGFSSESVGCAD
jgi:hypothetical protein